MNKKYILITILLSVFVAGTTSYAQEMNFYWAQQFGNDSNANNIKSIASDNRDNIIAFTDFEGDFDVDGMTYTADGSDLLVFSLNEEGLPSWVIAEGGPGNQIAQEVHCDLDGNVYIMGKFNSSILLNGVVHESNGVFDMYLVKYTNSGDFVWAKTFGGPNSESIETMKIKQNHIYLGGRFYNYTILDTDTVYSVDGTDVFISKMNLDGDFLNTISIGGESVDMISSIDVDVYGHVFIAGDFYQNIQFGETSFEAGEMLGLYMAKYDEHLNLDWAYQFEGDDLRPGLMLSLDSESEITVAGSFSSELNFNTIQLVTNDFDEDLFVAHFSTDGEIDWAHRFYSNSMESVIGLKVDRFGNSYITGHYLDHIHFNELVIQYNLCCGDPEIFFVKLDKLGEVVNANQLTGERSGVATMAVPEVNQVILAGHFSEEFNIGDIVLHSPTSYNVFITYYKDDTWLGENIASDDNHINIYPNPFKSSFRIKDLNEDCQISIYNENGLLIQKIHNQDAELHLGHDWSSGFYMIQILNLKGEYSSYKFLKL